MTVPLEDSPRPLPDRPSLRHLKLQAKDLLKSGEAKSIADAHFKIARLYGFPSWPKLKAHIDSLEVSTQLKDAVEANDVDRVRTLMAKVATQHHVERLNASNGWSRLKAFVAAFVGMNKAEINQLEQAIGDDDVARVQMFMTRNPALHHAPIGYGRSGPLSCVAECSTPEGRPTAVRLAMARWMIENGSDVHQGGDGPLMRAALDGRRIPMMDLLVSYGADVNAEWKGEYPILFAACEGVDPVALKWLLDHGANPNCDRPNREHQGTALDYVIGSYVRSPQFSACIDVLLEAGAQTKYDTPVVLALLRGDLDRLKEYLRADSALVTTRFGDLDFGATGGRLLTVTGSTLLHIAAEYGNLGAINLLLKHGADINARAAVDQASLGGQTPIFHAVTQLNDGGVPVAQFLIERGADLAIRAKLPGHYERPREVIECTPLGYALRFQDVPNHSDKAKTVALLRERGAPE